MCFGNFHARKKIMRARRLSCIASAVQKPVGVNWLGEAKSQEDARSANGNIGLLLGPKSGVMDVDLDCLEANGLADLILPQPFAKFSRGSSDSGHYLY